MMPRFAIAVACCLSATAAGAVPECKVGPDQKAKIQKLLCGQFTSDAAYRFTGPDCFLRSTQKRAEDTSTQIFVFGLCGHPKLADRLTVETRETLDFMQTLSICGTETVDVRAVFEDVLKQTGKRLEGKSCSADDRKAADTWAPDFEKMLNTLSKRDLAGRLDTIGLRLDPEGNLIEK